MNVRFRLTAYGAAALFAVAGCSGTGMPSFSAPVSSAPTAGSMHANWWSCNRRLNVRADWWGCSTILIEPLAFDGSNFSAVKPECAHVDLDDAPVYQAASDGKLSAGTTTLSPVCVPRWHRSDRGRHWGWWHGGLSHRLFIVAYELGSNERNVRTVLAGPADARSSSWVFAPSSPGLTMHAGSSYVFFVAWTVGPPSATPTPSPTPTPSTTPAPATFTLVAPLRWTDDAFSNVAVADCSNVTARSAPSYVAASSGAFAVTGSVTLAPECSPASYESLYLIAVQTSSGVGSCRGSKTVLHKRPVAPKDSAVVDGWVIGGPVSSGTPSWVFDTSSDVFVTQACATYAFFVGALAGPK